MDLLKLLTYSSTMHFTKLCMFVILYILVSSTLASIANTTKLDSRLHIKTGETTLQPNETVKAESKTKLNNTQDARRRIKISRSTSSSSGEKAVSDGDSSNGASLAITSSSASSTEKEYKSDKGQPKSSFERTGWRKWHRKCPPCPEDMRKKWRDPSINWVCGAYQRARRSFKSLCMMEYRNCQDGTMFVKIKDHRCDNDTEGEVAHGQHFFYDYRVVFSDDSTDSSSDTETSSSHESSSSI